MFEWLTNSDAHDNPAGEKCLFTASESHDDGSNGEGDARHENHGLASESICKINRDIFQ